MLDGCLKDKHTTSLILILLVLALPSNPSEIWFQIIVSHLLTIKISSKLKKKIISKHLLVMIKVKNQSMLMTEYSTLCNTFFCNECIMAFTKEIFGSYIFCIQINADLI